EIPSPVAGTLLKKLADEDDVVEVGGDLALVGEAGEDDGDDSGDASAADDEAPAEDENEAAAEQQPEEAEAPAEEQAEQQPEKPTADTQGESGTGEGTEITMPALGESVTEGTVTRWLKDVGDDVEVDEPLLEVSTDKV
ncbi:biotin/lipoyl-containing protein, partial [Sediminivirga luteola]